MTSPDTPSTPFLTTEEADPKPMQRELRFPTQAPPETAVLTAKECAAWLQINETTLRDWGVPCGYIGRTPRYHVGRVLQWLHTREAA